MKEIVVKSKNGIHARPASQIVEVAVRYSGDVFLIKDGKKYNGKSIMSIMSMGIQANELINIEAIGDHAAEIETQLFKIIESIVD